MFSTFCSLRSHLTVEHSGIFHCLIPSVRLCDDAPARFVCVCVCVRLHSCAPSTPPLICLIEPVDPPFFALIPAHLGLFFFLRLLSCKLCKKKKNPANSAGTSFLIRQKSGWFSRNLSDSIKLSCFRAFLICCVNLHPRPR